MTAEQFCLRWNNHQSTLVSVFDGLFESGTLVDCTLAADGQYLKAHKVVLSACSPYLEALLSQHYNQHPIVILKDVKFEELKAMLEYMYRGEVNVTQEQLGRFLKAAETLKIKGLTNNDVGPAAGQITPIVAPTVTAANAVAAPVSAPPPGPVVAQIMSGSGDSREVPVRTRQDVRKSLPSVQPVQPPRSPIGNQISLVETLKNAPASLVIDIPPISPVNSKEGSISPTPRKRRKRKQSHNDDVASTVENNRQKLNSDVHSSNISEKSNESVLDVDPLAILETGLVKPEVKMASEYGDSEGELTMDEDYDASFSKAGPSNGSSGVADGGAWGAASDDGESSKGVYVRTANSKFSKSAKYERQKAFAAARQRRRRARMSEEQLEKKRAYDREYQKKKRLNLIKPIATLPPREQKKLRTKWRKDAKKYHLRKKVEKKVRYKTPPSLDNENNYNRPSTESSQEKIYELFGRDCVIRLDTIKIEKIT